MESCNPKEHHQINLWIAAGPPSVPNTKDTKLDSKQSATSIDNSEDCIEIRNHNTTTVQSTQPRITFLSSGFSFLLKNKIKKRKFTKADISNPSNFQHLSSGFGKGQDQPAPPSKPGRQTQLPQNGTSQPPARPIPPPVPTKAPRGRIPQLPSSLPPVQKNGTIPAAPPPPPPKPPGTTLPTVVPASLISNTLKPPVNDMTRVMESIRNGKILKKVDKTTVTTGSDTKTQTPNTESGNKTLGDALRIALEKRYDQIQHSDDESNQNADNDSEEWN